MPLPESRWFLITYNKNANHFSIKIIIFPMLFNGGEKNLNRYKSPSPLSVTTNKPILYTNLLYIFIIHIHFFTPIFFSNFLGLMDIRTLLKKHWTISKVIRAAFMVQKKMRDEYVSNTKIVPSYDILFDKKLQKKFNQDHLLGPPNPL